MNLSRRTEDTDKFHEAIVLLRYTALAMSPPKEDGINKLKKQPIKLILTSLLN